MEYKNKTMKKLLVLILFAFVVLSASAQTTILDYTELWKQKSQQTRLEVAIYNVCVDIMNTGPAEIADTIYAKKAASYIFENSPNSSRGAYLRRYTKEGINRKINPENLSDNALITGIELIFKKEYWIEEFLAGNISFVEYYTAVQGL